MVISTRWGSVFGCLAQGHNSSFSQTVRNGDLHQSVCVSALKATIYTLNWMIPPLITTMWSNLWYIIRHGCNLTASPCQKKKRKTKEVKHCGTELSHITFNRDTQGLLNVSRHRSFMFSSYTFRCDHEIRLDWKGKVDFQIFLFFEKIYIFKLCLILSGNIYCNSLIWYLISIRNLLGSN